MPGLGARLYRLARLARWRAKRRLVPALPVEQSVTRNFLVCLETGTRHVVLGRHLREKLGLTPSQYRRRWGLADDYPMVAAIYSERRATARSEQ
jgi:predicted transcriptional regulator